MLDFFHVPNDKHTPGMDVQYFTGHTAASGFNPKATDCSIWKKPRGATMVHIFLIGAGGGGGGGSSQAAGTNKGGGGAGGSGAWTTMIVPALHLPDKLYVIAGAGGSGGAGGATGVAGNLGTASYVFMYPDANFNATNVLVGSSNTGSFAAAGQGGTSSAGGSGGAGASVFSVASGTGAFWGVLGITFGAAGNTGGAGGSPGGAGANATQLGAGDNFCIGGGGGGGATSSGGAAGGGAVLNGQIAGPVSEASQGVTPITGVSGAGGYMLKPPDYPLCIFGGAGGSGSNATAGGNGGHGVYGSGGGGGGAGTTGGTGGNGGDGLIVITCW